MTKEVVSKEFHPTNYSPLDPIRAIMVGAPGPEAIFGLNMPGEISRFELDSPGTCSVVTARQEHERMQQELTNRGIHVYNMRAIIGKVLAERQSVFSSKESLLAELKSRVNRLRNHYHMENTGNRDQIMQELENLVDADIQSMGLDPALAINAVLTNCIDINGKRRDFKINQPAAANFMFWRDTNHLTGDTFGTHQMFEPIRKQEVILAKLGMNAIGLKYKPVFKDGQKGSIEGGDILPMEIDGKQYAIIGRAERTSDEGVDAWYKLHEDLWKPTGEGLIPMVVEGPISDMQDQMHTDTHTQQFSKDGIVHCGEITQNRKASILTRKKGDIVKVDTQVFRDWIEKKFPTVYNMTRKEQLAYAPNILVDKGDTVYITRDGTPEVTDFIRNHVAETVLLHMNNFTKMYGGAHCGTSEMRERR
ncbi:arginine deiminase family protein [Patescibacteria group bacterium]|nr:arginine deiminase family protein [Patescibacteria group bacterium]